jgi:uncharacterized RDD family membrane protein YckC
VDPPLSSLARRAVAIVIDAIVFVPIFIAITSTKASPPGQGFYLGYSVNGHDRYLTGVPLLVALLLWVAYMAVCEGTIGASLGKAAMGIRVRTVRGTPIGMAASTIRNLARFVDVLPFFYVLGAIVARVSPMNQRIGDRLGRTVVVGAGVVTPLMPGVFVTEPGPPPPLPPAPRASRRWVGLITGLLVIMMAVAAYTVVDRPQAGVYQSHGLTVHYPSSWHRLDGEPLGSTGDEHKLSDEAFGIDPSVHLDVSVYELNYAVTDQNFPLVEDEINDSFTQLLQGTDARVAVNMHPTDVKGLHALAMTIVYPAPVGDVTEVETLVFRDAIQYEISCGWNEAQALEMKAACDRVVETVEFD